MKIVIAIDKFKGCATAAQLTQCIDQALKKHCNNVVTCCVPIADGGDGTTQAVATLLRYNDLDVCHVVVPPPLPFLEPISAEYVIDSSTHTAYMDLATASGLALVPHAMRDVMKASTRGTGVMIADALARGAKSVVLGLGGSATCDAAMGVLEALGFRFIDAHGKVLEACGANLEMIAHVDRHDVMPQVSKTKFILLADVTNPLLGSNGAAAVFAPQKGASPSQVVALERGVGNFSRFMPHDIITKVGAGAAGGVAAGMSAFLGAEIRQGIDYVLDLAQLDEMLTDAQLVITGEGRIDKQTSMGKAPWGVLQAAKRHGVPVVALCGAVAAGTDVESLGFAQVIEITPPGTPLSVAMDRNTTLANIEKAIASLASKCD